jgi:ABC-type glycerol-3-phosphate transport system substrate-binding protein
MNCDDPRMINLYRIIKEFNDRGYWGPNAVGVSGETEDSDFLTNKIAMRFQGSWFIPQLTADYQGDISNIGIAPFPYINDAICSVFFIMFLFPFPLRLFPLLRFSLLCTDTAN